MSLRKINLKTGDNTCKVKELERGDYFVVPSTGTLYRMIHSNQPIKGYTYPIVEVGTGELKPDFNREERVLKITVDIVEV